MASEGFHGLVVADDDDIVAIPGGHCRYLSGYAAPATKHLAVVVPVEGDPALIVPPGPLNCFPRLAAERSWITNIVSSPVDAWPPKEDLVGDIATQLTNLGCAQATVGLCGSFPGLAELGDRLPGATFAATAQPDARGIGRDIVERARAIKSDWEFERLRAAQVACNAGAAAFMAAVQDGRSYHMAISAADAAAAAAGSHQQLTAMSASRNPWFWWIGGPGGPTAFNEGDLVAFEFNARIDGYVAQVARSGVLGRATATQDLVLDTARASLQAMLARLEPGVTGGQLWDAGMGPVRGAGLQPWGRYGHGMGLCMAETLDVMPDDNGVVRDGQSLMLHAGIIDPTTQNSALIGDQVVVADGRVQLLAGDSALPHDLAPAGE
jgi:Xaa-Pro aminopeptidase